MYIGYSAGGCLVVVPHYDDIVLPCVWPITVAVWAFIFTWFHGMWVRIGVEIPIFWKDERVQSGKFSPHQVQMMRLWVSSQRYNKAVYRTDIFRCITIVANSRIFPTVKKYWRSCEQFVLLHQSSPLILIHPKQIFLPPVANQSSESTT